MVCLVFCVFVVFVVLNDCGFVCLDFGLSFALFGFVVWYFGGFACVWVGLPGCCGFRGVVL